MPKYSISGVIQGFQRAKESFITTLRVQQAFANEFIKKFPRATNAFKKVVNPINTVIQEATLAAKISASHGKEIYDKALKAVKSNLGLATKEGGFSNAVKKVADAERAKIGRGADSISGTSRMTCLKREDITTALNSAKIPKRGGEYIVGHSLQKHAGRHPETWGRVKGNAENINKMALKHLQEVLDAPGNFVKIQNETGPAFLEKRLSDGRGVRLNLDKTFKGFID